MDDEERPFLAAIQASPSDHLRRLVYADWLDERGRPEGEFLRIECDIVTRGPADESRPTLLTRLHVASRGVDPVWIAAVSRLPIDGTKAGTRCIYCHSYIAHDELSAHTARHRDLLPDGQYRDYASLPPEEQHHDSLAGVPRVYRHLGCGGQTVMQEGIVRTYLKDPFWYDDFVFCTGCGAHVSDREFVWVETGENVRTYMDRLKARHRPPPPSLFGRITAGFRNLFN